MTRVRLPLLTAGLTFVAASAFVTISACSDNSSFSQPRISPPPSTPTPVPTKGGPTPSPTPSATPTGSGPTPTPTPSGTPSATLTIVPNSLSWSKGQHQPQGVSLVPSNPSESFNFSLAGDTCGKIASSGTIFYNTVQITPGSVNGKCTFTYQDNVTGALGVLSIDNEGN